MHRREHGGVLSHTQVIVGAPHGDLARSAGMTVRGAGEGSSVALNIRKYAVPSFAVKVFKLLAEVSFVVHGVLRSAQNG
jgi:hypothetical protein